MEPGVLGGRGCHGSKKEKREEDKDYMNRYTRIDRESGAQEALFDWLALQKGRYPEMQLAFHIPNGGKRNAAEAAHLKRQGVKAGVPDICLPVAKSGYHGLYIELKVGKNKPTEMQKRWIGELNAQGYRAVVCYGWEEAAKEIHAYLTGEEDPDLWRN